MVGKLNHSISDSSQGDFYDGGYTEAVIGYAYRPVDNDRLNALAKYTYFYNVPTTDQVTLQNTAAEFIQKSHIAALDLTYDLTAAWSIGGKYAYRLGQVSLDREDRQFFDNSAQLVIAAHRLAVPGGLGRHGRGPHARPARRRTSGAAARWSRSTATSASTSRSAPATTSPTSRTT